MAEAARIETGGWRTEEPEATAPDAVRWLAFPVILGATIAAAIALLPTLGGAATVGVLEIAAALTIMAAERLFPFRRAWGRSHGDLRCDLAHAAVSGIGPSQLVRPFIDGAAVLLAGALLTGGGLGLWPPGWPLVAQLALALLLAELPLYWLHRWQHEKDWLWRFHSVHHSAPRLYWLNAARFHPVDLGLLYAVGYVPLLALGCPDETLALFFLFDGVVAMLQHCNIDVHLGPLNRVFSMAEPHRWHHSRRLEDANTNYGSNLIVWDLLFGTFHLPGGRKPPVDLGIGDLPGFPCAYPAQLAVPFRWRRVKQGAAGSSRPPSTSPLERIAPHRKRGTTSRRAYGLRDEECLRLKILTTTLPPI